MKPLSIKTLKGTIASAFSLKPEEVGDDLISRLKAALDAAGVRLFTVYWAAARRHGGDEYGPHLIVKAMLQDDVEKRVTRRVRVAPDMRILEQKDEEPEPLVREYGRGRDPRQSLGDYGEDER